MSANSSSSCSWRISTSCQSELKKKNYWTRSYKHKTLKIGIYNRTVRLHLQSTCNSMTFAEDWFSLTRSMLCFLTLQTLGAYFKWFKSGKKKTLNLYFLISVILLLSVIYFCHQMWKFRKNSWWVKKLNVCITKNICSSNIQHIFRVKTYFF